VTRSDALPERVRIYEVGPRDGLQNERTAVSTPTKRRFVELLVQAGLREIEATSFVSPRAIPQLADADVLLRTLPAAADGAGLRYPVLVANQRGFDRATAAGATAIAVFTAASDRFAEQNIGMDVARSLATFGPLIAAARARGWWVRAYVSTAFGCPFVGRIEPARVVEVVSDLAGLGVDEVCLGDTIGVGVPSQVHDLTGRLVAAGLPVDRLAYHFHDTRGTALANVMAGLEDGIACFDSSTGGTGGCPYAPGAAGNLATEDLVYLLDGLGIAHGVRLEGVLEAARFIAGVLDRPLASKVGQAGGWDPASGMATGRP
jgi:hydroxymethylglutaryl-CoA lyase